MKQGLGILSDVSLADQAKERIRTAVLEGDIKPGERITIEQIAAELGISRTPVREALKALEVDGVVKLLPRRGAVVESMAREEIVHRYDVRAMLEGYAAYLACKADGEELGKRLAANCDALEAQLKKTGPKDLDEVRALSVLNQEFHAIIRDGCKSATVIRLLESFRNPLAFTVYYWSDPERQHASLKMHREIANSFLDKRPSRARSLMKQHLLEARDQFMMMG